MGRRVLFLSIVVSALLGLTREAHAGGHWRVQHKFDRLDTNGDGVISHEEYAVAARWLHERADADGDGHVSSHELRATREPFVRDLKRFDTDGDGRVSIEELLRGKRAQFDRVDLDRNGSLSSDEFANGHERL